MHTLILQCNHRHAGALNERMQSMDCLMKPPGLCTPAATTLHQVPSEEHTTCIQPDLNIPAYGVLSGKLFHKTCLWGTLLLLLIVIKYKSTT